MNAKEAKSLAKKSNAVDTEKKRQTIEWAKRTVEESKRKKAERKVAVDALYAVVQGCIEWAVKRGEYATTYKTRYEDKNFKDEVIKRLKRDGFKVQYGKNGYLDYGPYENPYDTAAWVSYEVIEITWE
jgi:hypothetical protein